ncbi:MAG TPA: hypothetical protein VM008_00905 [Phycisphaerae bacterium]|nr:hypothetical protein [Phycisphaerae bacterium]
MAKRPSTEEHLAMLRRLREGPAGEHQIAALEALLKQPQLHGIVVKLAADAAMRCGGRALAPALAEAAGQLMGGTGAKRDPGCEGKTAIAKALVEWGYNDAAWFVELARYRQIEPGFGGPNDTAGECRGIAAIAIARLAPEGAIILLADLLVDEKSITRANAAVALGQWAGSEAAPLLRLKAQIGDDDAEVIGETLASLLGQDPEQQLAFVCSKLRSPDARIVEAAALALGQSRLSAALQPLIDCWNTLRRAPVATSILTAIALLRTPESVDWLVATMGKVMTKEGETIVDALRIYRGDSRIRERVRAATQGSQALAQAFHDVFGD